MTFPDHWMKKTVTCLYGDTLGGVPAGETVLFVSKQIVVVDGQVVVPKTQVATIGTDGSISIDLPTTDDPNLASGSGFAYTVYERFDGGRPPFAIFVPYDGDDVDLATAAPVVPPPELVSTQGPAGTVTIDSTTTLAPGSDATVQNTGTAQAAKLAFGIPRGDTGAPGTTDYRNLQNLPTLGTVASHDLGEFATAAQGDLAATAIQMVQLGIANGVATLGGDGKLDGSQIPAALLGSVSYQGTWDASAGTDPSATPSKGQYWVVSVAGSTSLGGITDWKVGDWAIYDTMWDKVDNTDGVGSVAGLTGIITAAALRTAMALATIATSGSYNDLLNLPTLGSAAAADFTAMPFVNLMPDSGMFGGAVDPFAGTALPTSFATNSLFISPFNGGTMSNDGSKFILNNTTNGGTAGDLTEAVIALMTALGRSGAAARYGTEFYVAQMTAGDGTNVPLATPDGTMYQMTGGSAPFASANNDETFVGWVRVRAGTGPFYIKNNVYIDGVLQVGSYYKFPDNNFHHVRNIVRPAIGYQSGFPFFYASSGTVIDIALPGFFAGLVDVGLHKAPLKTINAVSGGQPAPMPLAGGVFGAPFAPASYTKALLPSPATYNGYLVRVTDATGGPALCMSDGTTWVDVHTGSAVA